MSLALQLLNGFWQQLSSRRFAFGEPEPFLRPSMRRCRGRRPCRRTNSHIQVTNGSTLVELLVILGILVALMGILLPAMNRTHRSAVRVAMQADLQTLTIAIDAYQSDFGNYPRPDRNVTSPFQGSAILCWALLAPGPASQDGADGLGFRLRGTQGDVKGPYLPLGRFFIGTLSDQNSPIAVVAVPDGQYDDRVTVLADRYHNAILYYPKKLKAAAISSVANYIGPFTSTPIPRYISNDNDPVRAFGSLQNLQSQMPGVLPDGSLDASRVVDAPYLLWGAGPDGKLGTEDDVTNFK